MLPIVLDMKGVRIGVAGAGDGLRRRLDLVAKAGPEPAMVFDGRQPSKDELASLRILFVAGLSAADSKSLALEARKAGVLVNVEDQPALCDFHVPAQVRRGDLLITISTGGRSPALASALRELLEEQFGPEWDARLDQLAELRAAWRNEGAPPDEVSKRTRAYLKGQDWL
jgi:precorrin-2 dehydrogenase/sirohydrochlorin ferrochelatase